jgi:hypothetical protein
MGRTGPKQDQDEVTVGQVVLGLHRHKLPTRYHLGPTTAE